MIRLDLLKFLEEGDLKKYTREIIIEYAISPQKKLSQNFVVKKALIDEMLKTSEIKADDIIVEVGGGIGTLTYFLLTKAREGEHFHLSLSFCASFRYYGFLFSFSGKNERKMQRMQWKPNQNGF